jgi:hypothetical protein
MSFGPQRVNYLKFCDFQLIFHRLVCSSETDCVADFTPGDRALTVCSLDTGARWADIKARRLSGCGDEEPAQDSVIKPEWKKPHGRHRRRSEYNIKAEPIKYNVRVRTGFKWIEYYIMAYTCEHGNEPSGSIKEEHLDQLSGYQLLKKNSAARSNLYLIDTNQNYIRRKHLK